VNVVALFRLIETRNPNLSRKESNMTTQTLNPSSLDQRIDKLREIYAIASEISKAALENVIRTVKSGQPAKEPVPMASAGRIGSRQGKVSELTAIFPIKPAAAKRMRAFLELLHPDLGNQNVDLVGTVHDMRWVFLDNDTKILFASTYDGDWDPYIDDFGTKIPDILDLQFGEIEGWPGIRSPKIKDFIVEHQIPAYFWYVASPNLTVVETKRLEKVGPAVDQFLDQVA
jgi:hypothetical protein